MEGWIFSWHPRFYVVLARQLRCFPIDRQNSTPTPPRPPRVTSIDEYGILTISICRGGSSWLWRAASKARWSNFGTIKIWSPLAMMLLAAALSQRLSSHLEPSPVSYVAGAILEPSWSHLGFALGAILHVGPYLPHAWSHLGGHLGFTLGAILHWEPYWPHTLSHLGHALGAILEPSWPPHRGACLGLHIVVRPGVPRAQLLFSSKKIKA